MTPLSDEDRTKLEARLADLESAQIKIATGQVSRIRHGLKWIEYHKADIGTISAMIRDIRGQLGLSGARAKGRRVAF